MQKGEQHGSGCGVEDRENRVMAVVGKVESHARVSGEPIVQGLGERERRVMV